MKNSKILNIVFHFHQIITRIVPVSPHCFDHYEPAAEEGRLALFIVVLDLVSTAHYLAAFHHMLISAYGGQLGVPAHLLDQIKMVSEGGGGEADQGGYIELPSYADLNGSPLVLVRIRLTLEWASLIASNDGDGDGSGRPGHRQHHQLQQLKAITDPRQKRAILANWVTVKRVQWYGRLLMRQDAGSNSLLLVQLLQDIRRRFTVLRLLTPWKVLLLWFYFCF